MRCIGCSACFETRPSGAPQHEDMLLMASRKCLILRGLAKRGLEGRATFFQPTAFLRSLLAASGKPVCLPHRR